MRVHMSQAHFRYTHFHVFLYAVFSILSACSVFVRLLLRIFSIRSIDSMLFFDIPFLFFWQMISNDFFR